MLLRTVGERTRASGVEGCNRLLINVREVKKGSVFGRDKVRCNERMWEV